MVRHVGKAHPANLLAGAGRGQSSGCLTGLYKTLGFEYNVRAFQPGESASILSRILVFVATDGKEGRRDALFSLLGV